MASRESTDSVPADAAQRAPATVGGRDAPVYLEQVVEGHHGHRMKSESHSVGRAEVLEDGKLLVAITDHLPGRHAIAMLNDDLLDAVHWNSSVWLRVHDEPLGP